MREVSAEAQEWHRIIRASVRECLQTWHLQSKDGPVTVEVLEAILSRSMVPILRQMEDKPPELVTRKRARKGSTRIRMFIRWHRFRTSRRLLVRKVDDPWWRAA